MPPGTITTAESPIVASSAQAGPPVVGTGRLKRADVERVVDAGLGRFLGQVAIEPHLSAGRFTGWSIVGLQPPELWRGVDLQLGDVVTCINGMPIERDVQAFDAFQAVRHAEQLEVSYLRQGQSRTLRYAIIGQPSPALPTAPPGAKPEPAAAEKPTLPPAESPSKKKLRRP